MAEAADSIGLPKVPIVVADSIASWRRVIKTTSNEIVGDVLRNAAADLFRTRKINRTVYPDSDGAVNQAIVDALAEMADDAGIAPDDAQLIFSDVAQRDGELHAKPPVGVVNGHAAIGEPPLPGQASRFTPIPIDDVQVTAGPAWLVRHLLPARGLACIVGPPKSGKSFMTTDMLFSVARGAPYAGRETLPGPVIYLTGEGVMGFKRRLIAMRRHYETEGQGTPFFMIENVPDLGSEKTDVEDLLRELDRFILKHNLPPPRAVALDTLARCMGEGDENSARDMGRFVNRCGIIERHFACVVAAVHHMGKNPAAGGRGSNALNGAADVTLTVEKSEGYSTVRIDEMKDGPEGQEWRFRLVSVELSETSDPSTETMTETSTCRVELLCDASQAKPRETKTRRPPKGVTGDLLLVIRRAIDEAGQLNVDSDLVPTNAAAIDRTTLRRFCKLMAWQDQDDKPDAFRAMLSKTLSQLRSAGAIGFTTDFTWLT